MLTFLGISLPLLIASPWIIYYGSAYYDAIENELTPPSEREFKQFVMDPIPKGVSDIQTVGERDSLTSVVVIMFDEDPAMFPVLVNKFLLQPVAKEEQANCETINFSDCPLFDGADYFKEVTEEKSNLVVSVKVDPSRTKVFIAFRGIAFLHP